VEEAAVSLDAADPVDTATDVSTSLRAVADALEYPEGTSAVRLAQAAGPVASVDAAMGAAVGRLSSWLAAAAPGHAEERYSSLFDLRPVCTLHVGYHLFGEAYQRGALLSGLVAEMRKVGMAPGEELPDFLPNVLRLLAKTPPGEDRECLVDALLLPALTRMTEAMTDVDSPWADVVRALPEILAPLGGGTPLPPPERVTDIDLEADSLA
jgi:nitrate reductase delta subunit